MNDAIMSGLRRAQILCTDKATPGDIARCVRHELRASGYDITPRKDSGP